MAHVPPASQRELLAYEDHSEQESTTATGDNTNGSFEGDYTSVPALGIVATVKEFAARQEVAVLGQPGWILIKEVDVASSEQRQGDYGSSTGVAVPFQELVPADSSIFENWTHVDETGLYHEGLGLVMSADGTIYQHTVLLDGQWIHMTLRARGFPEAQTISSHDFTRAVLPSLRVAQSLEDIATLPNVRLTARLDGERYIVVKESTYDEPFNLGTPEQPALPAPAVGDITT